MFCGCLRTPIKDTMAETQHRLTTECTECGTTFTVRSVTTESVQFCPFCGDNLALAFNDFNGAPSLEEDDLDEEDLEGFNTDDDE